MQSMFTVAILENHQGTIDGYTYRLSMVPEIKIKATCLYAEELEKLLKKEPVDLLITAIDVHVGKENRNPFSILYFIDEIKKEWPLLKLLVISYVNQHQLVRSLLEAGINGFILKDDQQSIQQLGKIVEVIAGGGVYFSDGLRQDLYSQSASPMSLTRRQFEVISLCAAYPDEDTFTLAKRLHISGSTLRNILSAIYEKMGVRTRAAAILKARQLGIIPLASLSDGYHFEMNDKGPGPA